MTNEQFQDSGQTEAPVQPPEESGIPWATVGLFVATIVVLIAGYCASRIAYGLNGQPDRAISVVLFGPVVLALISSIMRVVAHYSPGKHWAKSVDGAGKIVALYASALLVGTALIRIFNWPGFGGE